MTVHLTTEDLLIICRRLSIGPVADPGLLGSAAARPRTSVLGEDAYPTMQAKAAALLQSLVRNHALVDGNKRLGWLAAVQSLTINGYAVTMEDDEAYDLVIAVAEGRAGLPDIVERLRVTGPLSR